MSRGLGDVYKRQGSGILALALARLGVPRVVAIDDDPQVLPLARENLARNGAVDVTLARGTAADLDAHFDLVVANLLADILVHEAAALTARVEADGCLVASGLLASQAPDVAAAYRGWRIVDEHRDEGWCTLVLGAELVEEDEPGPGAEPERVEMTKGRAGDADARRVRRRAGDEEPQHQVARRSTRVHQPSSRCSSTIRHPR